MSGGAVDASVWSHHDDRDAAPFATDPSRGTQATGLAVAHGARATLAYAREFATVVNAVQEVEEAARAAVAVTVTGSGREVRANADRVGFSEDLAPFLHHRPGCFVLLGNGTGGSHGRSLHHPQHDGNDAADRYGIDDGCRLVRGRPARWIRRGRSRDARRS